MDPCPFRIRVFAPNDAGSCLRLFRDTVHRVNVRDYSTTQVNAWAPPDMPAETWASRFDNRLAYVACWGGVQGECQQVLPDDLLDDVRHERMVHERIVGFTDMTRCGHLDRLFVSADHQRQGIARQLVGRVLQDARELGCANVTTEASITAKPFFEAMGFIAIGRQVVECRGVQMSNFKMQRTMDLDDAEGLATLV
ncbi:Acetyltransferase, GNAT family [Neorhodopirellula lusitana]|uniref:Acetyltransferase, GNAT family n=1 Tax=Neorhodopirellula lusitana TaxID=445327 RepID=A0ABY1Q8S2_9BACT|nr:GNAT family N-acetyltransferase [Neorhodopirellula lusitana]SMP59416.1 Acetyltransferase, GNAT family [Neorhodopirellula lusitana]